MFYKNIFTYFILIIIFTDCQSSYHLNDESYPWNSESELTNRKKPKKTYEFSLLESNETEIETDKKYISYAGVEKYILYCKEKSKNCNVTEIYNDLKGVSHEPLTYDLHASIYKNHIRDKFHIPDHLVSNLYKDLVNQIKEETKN